MQEMNCPNCSCNCTGNCLREAPERMTINGVEYVRADKFFGPEDVKFAAKEMREIAEEFNKKDCDKCKNR